MKKQKILVILAAVVLIVGFSAGTFAWDCETHCIRGTVSEGGVKVEKGQFTVTVTSSNGTHTVNKPKKGKYEVCNLTTGTTYTIKVKVGDNEQTKEKTLNTDAVCIDVDFDF